MNVVCLNIWAPVQSTVWLFCVVLEVRIGQNFPVLSILSNRLWLNLIHFLLWWCKFSEFRRPSVICYLCNRQINISKTLLDVSTTYNSFLSKEKNQKRFLITQKDQNYIKNTWSCRLSVTNQNIAINFIILYYFSFYYIFCLW